MHLKLTLSLSKYEPTMDDPLEVAGGGKKFPKTQIQEFLFVLRTEILCAWVKNCKEAAGRS